MASQPIYQIYAELNNCDIKIWRRFQVMNNIKASRLAYIVMIMFEMQANHLFRLTVPEIENFKVRYEKNDGKRDDIYEKLLEMVSEEPFSYFELPMEDEFDFEGFEDFEETHANSLNTTLKKLVDYPGQKLILEYDFGDGWEVTMKLEEIIFDELLPGKELPRVIEGEGYGIIEDCGGPWGLMKIARAYEAKSGEDYEIYREWLGTDTLDLKSFDIDDMNFRLKKLPRVYCDLYEYNLYPTKRSMDILERKYKEKK